MTKKCELDFFHQNIRNFNKILLNSFIFKFIYLFIVIAALSSDAITTSSAADSINSVRVDIEI